MSSPYEVKESYIHKLLEEKKHLEETIEGLRKENRQLQNKLRGEPTDNAQHKEQEFYNPGTGSWHKSRPTPKPDSPGVPFPYSLIGDGQRNLGSANGNSGVGSEKPYSSSINLDLEISALRAEKSALEASIASSDLKIQDAVRDKDRFQRDHRKTIDELNKVAQVLDLGVGNLKPSELALSQYLLKIRDACLDSANSRDTFQMQIDQAKKEIAPRAESLEAEKNKKVQEIQGNYDQMVETLKKSQRDMDVVIFEEFVARANELLQSPSKASARFPELETAEILLATSKQLMEDIKIRRRLFTLREAGYS